MLLACAWGLWDELREAEHPAQVLNTPLARMTLGAGVSGAAMAVAYLINSKYLSQRYTFNQYYGKLMGPFDGSAFLIQLRPITGYFGYEEEESLLSVRGIGNLLTIVLLAALVWALIKTIRSRSQRNAQERMLGDFTACALAIGLTLNVTLNEYRNAYGQAYYLAGVFALVIMLFAQTEWLDCRMTWMKTLCMLALSGIFVWQSAEYFNYDLVKEDTEHERAAAWLVENGYTQGYATFWNGNVLTESSDGQLELFVFDSWIDYEPMRWLQNKAHVTELPQSPVFVYVDSVEMGQNPRCAKEEHLVWQENGAAIFVYDSAEEFDALQRRLID